MTKAEFIAGREKLIAEFKEASLLNGGIPKSLQNQHVKDLFEAQEAWSDIDMGHKPSIMKALREGKPVPPEVLSDYPDIVKKLEKNVKAWMISNCKFAQK